MPNFMKICQTVRRWCLVTGGRTNNVVSTQCFVSLRHKGPVKSESFGHHLLRQRIAHTTATVQPNSRCYITNSSATIDRAQPCEGADLFYGRLRYSEFR
jgi:hypothetical protein